MGNRACLPVLPLELVEAKVRDTNTVTVVVEILLKDAKGRLFRPNSSCTFTSELKYQWQVGDKFTIPNKPWWQKEEGQVFSIEKIDGDQVSFVDPHKDYDDGIRTAFIHEIRLYESEEPA